MKQILNEFIGNKLTSIFEIKIEVNGEDTSDGVGILELNFNKGESFFLKPKGDAFTIIVKKGKFNIAKPFYIEGDLFETIRVSLNKEIK